MDYKGNLWSAILTLLAGIVMVFFSDIALHTVVLIVGALFIATAVFNLAFEFSRKRMVDGKRTSVSALLASAGAGILGILMMFTPAGMVNMIIYMFAVAIILLGLYQIVTLAFAYRPVTFPFWFFILPAILVITGVVICIIGAQKVGELMILITGIALIVYAIATFIEIAGLLSFRRDLAKAQKAAEDAAAETDAEFAEPTDAEETTASDSTLWPADRP